MSAFSQLEGKVAVVTGGASGIGKGIAQRLIANGMRVVIADIEEEALRHTAAEIGATGIRTDVSSLESVQALAEQVKRQFGTAHLVCNNAGIGSVAMLADMSPRDWQWIINVNLWGVIHGINAFLPMLQANPDGGHIINTSSMGGFGVIPGLGAYSATKFAVVAITEALAMELEIAGSRVGASLLCPGTVRTNIKNSARNRPAELAGALTDTDLENSEMAAKLRWADPLDVGESVVRGLKAGEFYIFTHPEMRSSIDERHARIAAAFDQAARLAQVAEIA